MHSKIIITTRKINYTMSALFSISRNIFAEQRNLVFVVSYGRFLHQVFAFRCIQPFLLWSCCCPVAYELKIVMSTSESGSQQVLLDAIKQLERNMDDKMAAMKRELPRNERKGTISW